MSSRDTDSEIVSAELATLVLGRVRGWLLLAGVLELPIAGSRRHGLLRPEDDAVLCDAGLWSSHQRVCASSESGSLRKLTILPVATAALTSASVRSTPMAVRPGLVSRMLTRTAVPEPWAALTINVCT